MAILRRRRTLPIALVVAATAIALLALSFGLIGSAAGESSTAGSSGSQSTNSLGGTVWYVMAVGAPFQPHLFTFHSDGSMLTHNPEAGDPGTSDSAGMGPWKRVGNKIIGRFVQVNAYYADGAIPHKYKNDLVVDFEITVTGNTFTGPAMANYYVAGVHSEGPYPATLNGTLITLDSPWPRETPLVP